MAIKLGTCRRNDTTCYDCPDTACLHAGDKGADCPKYTCDNAVPHDCGHCSYIDGYIRIMRQNYRQKA